MSEWLLTYHGFDPDSEGLRESLCTLANGYLGTRGAAPESPADDVHYPGCYIAGVYDRQRSDVAGRIVENEDLVNVPNWLPTTFRIDGGEWFDLSRVDILDYDQQLDLHRGVLTRLVRFRDAAGRVTRLGQRRLVSMADPHLVALETTIEPEGWSGELEVSCALDGRVTNEGVARYRSLNTDHLVPVADGHDEDVMWLQVETQQSRIRIAEAAAVRLAGLDTFDRHFERAEGWVGTVLSGYVSGDSQVTVTKTVAIYTSRDPALSESLEAARVAAARAADFDTLLDRHALVWRHLWDRAAVTLDGRGELALNLHMFHLIQVCSPHIAGLDVGMPARGLHGEAYRGHVFWDELFAFPFLSTHFPLVARSLLMYRYRRLPAARWAAAEAGYAGAMFPWQSGSDGNEETQRVHLNPQSGRWLPDNSRLQRHVNLAIVYNVWVYYQATGDQEFLSQYGAEIVLDIAKFLSSLANYNRVTGRYEIRNIMGPDEYHDAYPDSDEPGVNNSSYINLLTVWVLRRAFDVLDLLPARRAGELRELLDIDGEDLERFTDICRKMYVPFRDGVVENFERYGELQELDWEGLRARHGDIRRLDRVLEAENDSPNKYQATKQAGGITMLSYLLSDEEILDLLRGLGYECDQDCLDRTVDYYMARTSHGSTLSAAVYTWVLARRNPEQAREFFRDALAADLCDVQGGTTKEGVHLGAMAATVDLVLRGYAGMRLRDDAMRLDPRMPRDLETMTMEFHYRGHSGTLTFDRDEITVSLRRSGHAPMTVAAGGQTRSVRSGETVRLPLTGPR